MNLKKFNKTIYLEISIIVIIALLSFISFNYFFSNTESGGYYQNIISALMGTIFTVVITSFLLKQQVKSEELREQNVEVFKKKVEKYENLISLLTTVLEDGEINHKEAILIKKSIYEISLFCGKDTLDLVGNLLKQEIIGNFDEDEKISILEITSKMREELHLEGIETFDKYDLKPIEFLIGSNFELVPLYKSLYSYLFELRYEIGKILYDLEKEYDVGAIENLGSSIQFFVQKNNAAELDMYIVEIEFPEVKTEEVSLNLRVMKHSGKRSYNKHEHMILQASKLKGMEYIVDEDLPKEISGVKSISLELESNGKVLGNTISLAKNIFDDIEYTEKSFA